MTVAVFVAAIALALLGGVLIGRWWQLRSPDVRTDRSTRSPGAVHTVVDPRAADSSSSAVVPVRPADSPRAVPASAELRASDIPVITADGRMTKAGLLSLIEQHSETAVAVVDAFRDVVLYNHRAVDLGMVRDQLLAEEVWDAAREVLESGEEYRFEFSPQPSSLGFLGTGRATARSVEAVRCLVRLVQRADGEAADRDADGRAAESYAVVYGVDDSEHMRVEATRRDFVANVSHELKTPVGAIGLLTEALLESADDEESVRHFGQRVIIEANRLGSMVSELIALSRLQGGETQEFASVDVDALVGEAIDSATVASEAGGIRLHADTALGLRVRGDRTLLLTALNNLIGNAIAYSPPNTTVSISRRLTRVDGRPMVAIAVTDRGIGIAPADQQRVFERFFRVDKARSRQTGGTGLGLAIVKHVAANHGGVIDLWSKPGTGSTFTLRIPLDLTGEADPGALPDDPAATSEPPRSTRPARLTAPSGRADRRPTQPKEFTR